LCLWSVRSSVG